MAEHQPEEPLSGSCERERSAEKGRKPRRVQMPTGGEDHGASAHICVFPGQAGSPNLWSPGGGRATWPALGSKVRKGERCSHPWERAAGSSLLSGSTATACAHDGPGVARKRFHLDLNFS